MYYRYLGKTGTKASELCLGALTFGRESSDDISRQMMDRFTAAEGNFIDTADDFITGAAEPRRQTGPQASPGTSTSRRYPHLQEVVPPSPWYISPTCGKIPRASSRRLCAGAAYVTDRKGEQDA